MNSKFVEHLLSVVVVALLFVGLILFFQQSNPAARLHADPSLEPYLELESIDFGNPLDRALFRESMNLFSPHRADSLLRAIDAFRQEQFTNKLYKSGTELPGLTRTKLGRVAWMYVQFVLLYVVVIALTYYGSKTLAVFRFVKMKQHNASYLAGMLRVLRVAAGSPQERGRAMLNALMLLGKALMKGLAYAVLFSPAYVIAYSFKSSFDTGSALSMIVLGAVSNGLLITYANKFYTFLLTESRKGYVETAAVKNLNDSYEWGNEGIPLSSIFRIRKRFPSHVFQHIYINAREQYLPTLKEHASFVITGLIIIEMALNIHGHLSYELLQYILYDDYSVVALIVLAIFLLVKATEIVVDLWARREAVKYGNIEKR